MLRVVFEPTTLVFDREKKVHALELVVSLIGIISYFFKICVISSMLMYPQ
jgi:hypothetical protein